MPVELEAEGIIFFHVYGRLWDTRQWGAQAQHIVNYRLLLPPETYVMGKKP